MADKELIVRVCHAYATSAQWSNANPVLMSGEMGVESDTQKHKIGDGVTKWSNLSYASGIIVDSQLNNSSTNAIQNKVVYNALSDKASMDDILVTVGDYTTMTGREKLLVFDTSGAEAYMNEQEVVQSYANKAKNYADNALESKNAVVALETAMSKGYIKRDTAYTTETVAYSQKLPAGYYLECVTAGTTATTEPEYSASITSFTDGTCVWKVRNWQMKAMVDMFYPVGSVYMTTSDALPEFMDYGTWEEFSQGRTPIGVGACTDSRGESKTFAVGDTGGEYQHQLTADELAHCNGYWQHGSSGEVSGYCGGVVSDKDGYSSVNELYSRGTKSTRRTVIDFGQDVPHNNLSPYIAVHYYRRTA